MQFVFHLVGRKDGLRVTNKPSAGFWLKRRNKPDLDWTSRQHTFVTTSDKCLNFHDLYFGNQLPENSLTLPTNRRPPVLLLRQKKLSFFLTFTMGQVQLPVKLVQTDKSFFDQWQLIVQSYSVVLVRRDKNKNGWNPLDFLYRWWTNKVDFDVREKNCYQRRKVAQMQLLWLHSISYT